MSKKLPNIHPGEILLEEFLEPMAITPYRLAKDTMIDQTRISDIIHKKRRVSVDTALRFSRFFGTTPQFWLNLQNHYDMEEKAKELKKELNKIQRHEYQTKVVELTQR